MQVKAHRDGEAILNGDEEDAEEGAKQDEEVELVDLPDLVGGGDIDEAEYSGQNDGPEREVWGVLEERHQSSPNGGML